MIGYRKGYQLEQLADLTLPSIITNEKISMTPGIGDGKTAAFNFSGNGKSSEVTPSALCNSYGQTEDGYGMAPAQLKYGTDYQVMINGELVDRERFQVDTIKGIVKFKNIPYIKSGTSKQQPPKQAPKSIPFDPISKPKPEDPVYDTESTRLYDPSANFARNGVKPGMHLQNLTTGVSGEIVVASSGDSEIVNWTRVTTVMTVTQPHHEYIVDEVIQIVQSSSTLAINSGVAKVISIISDEQYTLSCNDAGDSIGTLAIGMPSNNVEGTLLYSNNPALLWQDKDKYQIISDEHSPALVLEGEVTETFPYLYDNTIDFLSERSEKATNNKEDGYIWVQKVRVGDTLVKNPGPNQIEGIIKIVTNHTLEAEGLSWQAGDTYRVYRKDSTDPITWATDSRCVYEKIYPRFPLGDHNDPDDILNFYITNVIRNKAAWIDPGTRWFLNKEIWVSTDYDFLSETWGQDSSWSGQIGWYRHTRSATGSVGRIHPGMVLSVAGEKNQTITAIITQVNNSILYLDRPVESQFSTSGSSYAVRRFTIRGTINLGKKGQAGFSGIAKDPTPNVITATDSVQLFNGKVNFNNLEWLSAETKTLSGITAPVTPGMYIENLTNPQDGLIDFVGPYIEATSSTTDVTKAKLNTYASAVQGIQGAITTGGQNIVPNIQEQLELAEIPTAYTIPATATPPFMSATPYVVTTYAVGTVSVPNTNPALYVYFTKLKLDMYKNLGLDKLNKMLWRNGDKYRITKQAEKTTIKLKIEGMHTAPQVFSPENFLQDNNVNFLIRGVHLGMRISKSNISGNTDGIITLVEQHRIQAISLDDTSKFIYWDVGDTYSISGEMATIDPEKPMTQLYDNFTDFTQELKPYLEKGETLYLKNVRTGHQGKIIKVQKNILEAMDGYGPNEEGDGYGHMPYPEKGPLLWYDGYGEEPYEISGTSNTNAPKNGDVLTCSYCTRDVTTLSPDFTIQRSRNSILTYSTSILPTQRRLGRPFTSS